ncbi:ABC transporter permease, partial [Desulfosoma sp.]
HKKTDAWLAPLIFFTYPIPKIVLLPVVLLLFGLGDFSKVFLIALIVGYQVLVAVRDGVAGLNPKYLDSVRTLGAGPWPLFRHVLLPAALPHGFTALRLGTGTGIAVLFFVESFATSQGLGYLIMDAWGRLDYRGMFVGILGMSLLEAALFETIGALERLLCRWQAARKRA